jgi:hypothetical protein
VTHPVAEVSGSRQQSLGWSGRVISREGRGATCRLPGLRVLLAIAIAAILTTACHFSSEYEAHSSPAQVGVPIEFTVFTDCGLDWMAFDIDGSLWVAKTIDPADRIGTPSGFASDNDAGTLTLLSKDLAEYHTSMGRVVPLTRLPGNFVVDDC